MSGIAELHLLENDIELFSLEVGQSYQMALLRVQGDRNLNEGFRFNSSWSTGFNKISNLENVAKERERTKTVNAEISQITEVQTIKNFF